MKKPFLLSLAFLAFYLPANAQFSFGIKGSLTNAWQSSDPSEAPKMQGLGTTLLIYKRVNKFLEIGVEPGIVQRGTSQMYGQSYNPFYCYCCFGDCTAPIFYPENVESYGLKTSYLQAPIIAKASLPFGKGKFALFGKFGSGLSWLASGYYDTQVYDDFSFEGRRVNKALDFSAGDGLKRWDWGLYSGAGLGCKLGFGMLSFETELYHGLSKTTDYIDAKNRGISYSVGYAVNL